MRNIIIENICHGSYLCKLLLPIQYKIWAILVEHSLGEPWRCKFRCCILPYVHLLFALCKYFIPMWVLLTTVLHCEWRNIFLSLLTPSMDLCLKLIMSVRQRSWSYSWITIYISISPCILKCIGCVNFSFLEIIQCRYINFKEHEIYFCRFLVS